MSLTAVIVVGVPVACLAALAVLTGVGSHRRGEDVVACVLAAAFFPITWVVWFVEDNHREGRSAFKGV